MLNLDIDGRPAAVWNIVATGLGASPDPSPFTAYCAQRTGAGCPTFRFADAAGREWEFLFYGGRNLMSGIVIAPVSRDTLREPGVREARETVNDDLCVLVEGRSRRAVARPREPRGLWQRARAAFEL